MAIVGSMQSKVLDLPVRGADAIEILLNDHRTIESLLERLLEARGAREQTAVFEQLKAALTIHNATEENLVYPALNKVAGKERESQKLYHETADANVLVFEIDTLLKEGDEAAFKAKAQHLRDAILEHIDDEENSAFPHLQEGVDPEAVEQLTESVRELRGALHFTAPGNNT